MTNKDPLKNRYSVSKIPIINKKKTALLCIDLQYFDAAPGHGIFKDVDADNLNEDVKYYFNRLDNIVLPNVKKLQNYFRENEMEVIHIRIQSLTKDGRDRSEEHKRIGSHVLPGSKEAEFLEMVAPVGDEIVISKTASGVFNSTNIDYILRNLKIEQLVIVGVVTNECVETAVRDASDRGYLVYVPEDCVAAINPEIHSASIKVMDYTYSYITSTDEIVSMMDRE